MLSLFYSVGAVQRIRYLGKLISFNESTVIVQGINKNVLSHFCHAFLRIKKVSCFFAQGWRHFISILFFVNFLLKSNLAGDLQIFGHRLGNIRPKTLTLFFLSYILFVVLTCFLILRSLCFPAHPFFATSMTAFMEPSFLKLQSYWICELFPHFWKNKMTHFLSMRPCSGRPHCTQTSTSEKLKIIAQQTEKKT